MGGIQTRRHPPNPTPAQNPCFITYFSVKLEIYIFENFGKIKLKTFISEIKHIFFT